MPRCLIPALFLALSLGAAEQDTEPTAAADMAALKARVGAAPLLVEDAGGLYWGSKGQVFQVVDTNEQGRVVVETDIGPIAVERSVFTSDRPATAATLGELVGLAAEADLSSEADSPLLFGDSILTDLRLRGGDHLVLVQGVLEKQAVPEIEAETARAAITEARQAFIDALPDTGLERPAQKSVEELVTRLDRADTGREDGDEVTPSFARRIVRHGWLQRIFPGHEPAAQLASAVEQGVAWQPKVSYRGDDLVLELRTDAFGQSGWFVSTPDYVRIAMRPPLPAYHWIAQETLRSAMVVVEFPAGTSLQQASALAVDPVAARLFHQEVPLAWWSEAEGFGADRAAWRKVVPAKGMNLDPNIVSDYLPPHIPITDLAGDIHELVVPEGLLSPPQGADRDSADAFLDRAAELLPDAAHLDLIGQYLFKYTYDSPDSTTPFLVGTKQVNGDIHQTAFETLATTTGGICRGDCDDLSELYQDILTRQGKTAHVISLPAHAAVAWAEEAEDGWHVYVMQTGPSLEFVKPRIQDALAAAYTRFDATDTFDPNGLGLLLRFSGENTRSGWRLSYRIFTEPSYAKTMIDVQRDWHYQTYMEGIRKMEELIASGDEDTANYRELAGLFSFTGQHEKAAEYLRKAIDRTPEASSRLLNSAELVGHLIEAGDEEAALEVVTDILDNQLPPLRPQLGAGVVQLGLQLSGTLLEAEDTSAIGVVMQSMVQEELTKMSQFVTQWVATRFNQRAWDGHPQLRQIKRLLNWHARTTFTLLREHGAEAITGNPELAPQLELAERWLRAIAFRDVSEPSDTIRRYAEAGTYYAGLIGFEDLLERIEAVETPDPSIPYDHLQRAEGLQQLDEDLPWIKMSPGFWQDELGRLVNGDEVPADRELVERIAAQLEAAEAAVAAHDLDSPFLEYRTHYAKVIIAMLTEDEALLRELLQRVAEKDDKRMRDDTAMWIGNSAKHTSMKWWRQVIDLWHDELDYKPKYYWIAWRAALNDAPSHALEMAEFSAERFADDPAFVQEERFMRELLEEAAAQQELVAP